MQLIHISRSHRIRLALIFAILGLVLVACGGANPAPLPTAKPATEATAAPIPTVPVDIEATAIAGPLETDSTLVSVSKIVTSVTAGAPEQLIGVTIMAKAPYEYFSTGTLVFTDGTDNFEMNGAIRMYEITNQIGSNHPVELAIIANDTVPPGVYEGVMPMVFYGEGPEGSLSDYSVDIPFEITVRVP